MKKLVWFTLLNIMLHLALNSDYISAKVTQRDLDLIKVAYQNGFVNGLKYALELDGNLKASLDKFGGLSKDNKAIVDRVQADTNKYLKDVIEQSGGIIEGNPAKGK
jgi:hypothetical protein